MKTNVYVDGFNLYYGCVKGTPYKWLDLACFCHNMLTQHQINRIRYFTARVRASPQDPGIALRQQTYIRALETIPHLSVHYGFFLTNTVWMRLATPLRDGTQTVQVVKTEEKGSDVNLATYLLLDGFDDDYEMAVIVSNDSDLREPIEIVRQRRGLPVGVLNPHRNTSHALRQVASFYRRIRAGVLSVSQFSPLLTDAQGREIKKPASW